MEVRKTAGLIQKAVAERLRRGDGRSVLPPCLNDLENDWRFPPEYAVIERPAKILNLSSDVFFFCASLSEMTGLLPKVSRRKLAKLRCRVPLAISGRMII